MKIHAQPSGKGRIIVTVLGKKKHARFCGRYVASGRRNLVLQRGLHHHKAGDSIGSFLLTLLAGTTVPDHLLQRLLLFLSPPPLSVLLFRRKENFLFLRKRGKVLAFPDVRRIMLEVV
jgi:hypothetical protein